LFALSGPAVAQYVEVVHTETYVNHVQNRASFTVQETGIHTFEPSASNWFRVEGDLDPAHLIPWRTRFASIANNNWTYQDGISVQYLSEGTKVHEIEDYYTRVGQNVFVPGSSSSIGARSLDERVTTDIYYLLEIPEGE
jgi:hypothetical protein